MTTLPGASRGTDAEADVEIAGIAGIAGIAAASGIDVVPAPGPRHAPPGREFTSAPGGTSPQTAGWSTPSSSWSSLRLGRAPTMDFTGSPPWNTISVGIDSTP